MSVIKNRSKTLSNLVSQRRDIRNPIFNWFTYKHSFSEDLVSYIITQFGLKKGSFVMDPFCGGGTTLLACKKLGLNSYGYDILPFSVFLSNIKVDKYPLKKIEQTYDNFLKQKRSKKSNYPIPDIPLLKKAYSIDAYNELLSLKREVYKIENEKVKGLFLLALLNILEKTSKTSKSGAFLRIINKRVHTKNIRKLFLIQVESFISDLKTIKEKGYYKAGVLSKAQLGDARKIRTKRQYDAVITSPPYPNRHDYTRVYALELLFNFIDDNDSLKKLRYNTLRSHVEARKIIKRPNFVQPSSLSHLISKVNSSDLNNPQITSMLEGYFEDMFLCLKSIKKCLKTRGKVAMVVSNVRFSGIYIPVDKILLEIGKVVGLKPQAIWSIRFRGNSSQQMREFKRLPSRESIIIWNNK